MCVLKIVETLDQIEKVKNSVLKISEKSYVVNNNGLIFSCLGKVNYQIVVDRLGKEKLEMFLTCSNRNFAAFIR